MKLDLETLKLKLNQNPSETISHEVEMNDDDLADDTKCIRVQKIRKKRKLAD
jgi:hypothetical protein